MEYVEAQGARIPKIGLGTWMLEGERCREAVERALALGYRHIDTAQAYENEAEVGAGLAAGMARGRIDRDELFVTTKLSMDNLTRDRVGTSARESLERLALDRLDLLLIHWPSEAVPLRETLEAMLRLVEQGLVRHLGVSNFPPPLLEEALSIAPLLTNQVEHHPFLGQDRLLEVAAKNDLCLTAYSPLARGRVETSDVLRSIGEAHGKSASQVALRWLTQHPNECAIPKASSEAHLRANLDIFGFALSAGEMRRVAGLARGERLIDPAWAPRW